jgi:hypothetical protein
MVYSDGLSLWWRSAKADTIALARVLYIPFIAVYLTKVVENNVIERASVSVPSRKEGVPSVFFCVR